MARPCPDAERDSLVSRDTYDRQNGKNYAVLEGRKISGSENWTFHLKSRNVTARMEIFRGRQIHATRTHSTLCVVRPFKPCNFYTKYFFFFISAIALRIISLGYSTEEMYIL